MIDRLPTTFAVILLLRTVAPATELPETWQAALKAPRADSLRGHVSFLASDLLEGRDTPSRGLDIAAEYIASQYRRAGLEPIGDGGYYQSSLWQVSEPASEGFLLEFRSNGESLDVPAASAAFEAAAPLHVDSARVFFLDLENPKLDTVGTLDGRVVITRRTGLDTQRLLSAIRPRLKAAGVAAMIVLDSRPGPSTARRLWPLDARPEIPTITVRGDAAAKLNELHGEVTVSLNISPVLRTVTLRNVVGVLRGSDPSLRDSCVILTAHYDHEGMRATGEDRIYNGANDDASGVAVMLETAAALSAAAARPKRSIVFLAVFGEEKIMLGSRYYAAHPLFPLEKTVAALNLEVLGRTDSRDGPRDNRIAMTGYGYSTVTDIVRDAGKLTGIEVYRDGSNSDRFFTQSDNIAFAERGIPAHTLSTGYLYPDYHQPGDHWDKLDYPHLEKATRLVLLSALKLADLTEPPHWSADNPRTERYREQAEKLH